MDINSDFWFYENQVEDINHIIIDFAKSFDPLSHDTSIALLVDLDI